MTSDDKIRDVKLQYSVNNIKNKCIIVWKH